MSATRYRCFLFNFGWFLHGEFENVDMAVEYGKSKGYEFTVWEVRDNKPETPLCTWSPIGGLRRYAA